MHACTVISSSAHDDEHRWESPCTGIHHPRTLDRMEEPRKTGGIALAPTYRPRTEYISHLSWCCPCLSYRPRTEYISHLSWCCPWLSRAASDRPACPQRPRAGTGAARACRPTWRREALPRAPCPGRTLRYAANHADRSGRGEQHVLSPPCTCDYFFSP